MNLILMLLRAFILYQLLEIAAAAGLKGDVGLLIFDIIIAYIIHMHLWPVFPMNNNHTNNTGG